MVTTGFSKPYVAPYSNNGKVVTYGAGAVLGRGVQLSVEPEVAEDNDFYADNVLAEQEGGEFVSGKAKITVDGLTQEAAAIIYKLQNAASVTVGDKTVEMQGYGKATTPSFVGYGCVRRTKHNGVTQFWPLILPKIKFDLEGSEMATQEEQIDWQTQEMNATIFRDDTEEANWKLLSKEGMATEEEAYAVVVAYLSKTA